MHVSPCGWYCFELDRLDEWIVTDTKEKTLVEADDSTCYIELLAARKNEIVEDVEISNFHEDYLLEEKLVPLKTVMTDNLFKVVTIVTRCVGPDERFWIICHAFWDRYCAFVQFKGHRGHVMTNRIQTFYNIVNTLQPLVSG